MYFFREIVRKAGGWHKDQNYFFFYILALFLKFCFVFLEFCHFSKNFLKLCFLFWNLGDQQWNFLEICVFLKLFLFFILFRNFSWKFWKLLLILLEFWTCFWNSIFCSSIILAVEFWQLFTEREKFISFLYVTLLPNFQTPQAHKTINIL